MKYKKYWPVLCWGAASLFFTLLIILVDAQPAGVNGTRLGLAGINTAVHKAVGVSLFWYHVSKTMGVIAIGLALFFAALGLRQWILLKDLKKVHRVFFGLAVIYGLLAIMWKLFDALAINYRPLLENGKAEPSFPSTHTLLALVIFGSAVMVLYQRMEAGRNRTLLMILGICAAVLTVLARFLAGVHWLTDIIGGVLFSGLLLSWFWIFIKE